MTELTEADRRLGAANAATVHRREAARFDARIRPLVIELRRQGYSLRRIALDLTERGVATRHGCPQWSARQVLRMLRRWEPTAAETPGREPPP